MLLVLCKYYSYVYIEWRTALKSSRRLAQSKKASYWKSEIHSAGNNARHVWHTVDNLLGEAISGAKPTFSPENYHSYIDKKVADVRASTSTAPSLQYTRGNVSGLDSFKTMSIEDVITAVRASPSKQCASDPLPTWLLKEAIIILAPYITTIFNSSITERHSPRT